MGEKKICSYTKPGYKLQLLQTNKYSVNPRYQIRENRRIKANYTCVEDAYIKFCNLVANDVLQTRLEL